MVDAYYEGTDLTGMIDQEVCFSNHEHEFKEKIQKEQLKLLQKIASFLKHFLTREERILLLAPATSPSSALEQYLGGWRHAYIKRCILIFTNKRILHLPTKSDYTPKKSIAQIKYGDIEKYKTRSFLSGAVTFNYKNGKKETFSYLTGANAKKIDLIIPSLISSNVQSEVQQRQYLCPRCTNAIPPGQYTCSSCNMKFKDIATARKRALIYPGGGYFYTGHPFLGIANAFVEVMLIIFIIASIKELITENNEESLPATIGFAILLILAKSIDIYLAGRYVNDYIPIENL